MNNLLEKYNDEVQTILNKYPDDQKRSAVMPLLYVAQREKMYVSQEDMAEVAEIIGVTPTEVASIIGFYSLYYDKPGAKFRIQVCTDLPCALRGADQLMEELCHKLKLDPHFGVTTEDDKVTVEAVMCLAACDKAPMFQLQSGDGIFYHENQTVESAMELVEELRHTP
ncbi:MAG TPA: NADH-quinone oxidoreductase subunit NuoE [Anaerolineales bacterium]|nr:NADH-quinone oxidoreductase subunit NuoE [Anaerolineales bacterium]